MGIVGLEVEPFWAGDEITRGRLQDELQRIYAQTHITILFVTNDISETLKLGTKVLVMDQGKIQLVERNRRTYVRV